jgi:hypothetical protein
MSEALACPPNSARPFCAPKSDIRSERWPPLKRGQGDASLSPAHHGCSRGSLSGASAERPASGTSSYASIANDLAGAR